MADESNDVVYKIILEAAAALQALDDMAKQGLTVADAFKLIQMAAQDVAKATGASLEQVLGTFAQVASQAEGMAGGKGLIGAVLGSGTPTEVAEVAAKIEAQVKSMGASGEKAYKQVGAAEKEATVAARGFLDVTNMVRMALGTLEAMVIFQVVMAISSAYQEATESARTYYQSLIDIGIAQEAMAAQGVTTTNAELLRMADELTAKMKIFSTVDMTAAVSQATLLTTQFKLSHEQISQIVQMSAVLAAGKPGTAPGEYIDKVLSAAKGSTALWAVQMGIAMDADTVKAKAYAMGLWDGVDAISEQAKELAGLQLLWEKLGPRVQTLQENTDTSTAMTVQLGSEWKNFLTEIGKYFAPFSDFIKGFLITALQVATFVMQNYMTVVKETFSFIAGALNLVRELMAGHILSIQGMVEAYAKGHDVVAKFYDAIIKRQQTGGVNVEDVPVTPGGIPKLELPPALNDSDFNAIMKAYQTYYDGVIKATENFNERMRTLQEDYNLRVQKEMENTDLRIAEERQNFRLKQIQEEQNFQQRMRELTNQYLLDLEDALRKRDAEAVIKLINRYNNEKAVATQQQQLKQQQMQQEENLKIKQMKQEEQLRLKQMADEYELQKTQAQRAYQQQLADLARALDNKLQEQAAKLAQEHKLNEEGMKKLYELFKKYYGPEGKFASEQQSSYVQMLLQSSSFVAQMQAIMSQYYNTLNTTLGSDMYTERLGGGKRQGDTGKGYASGGIAMANTATSVTFGEAGPELAMFLPLNSGAAGGSVDVYGGGKGFGGGGGVALIRIEVGSDLEARIVNSALTHAAIAIERVNRSR